MILIRLILSTLFTVYHLAKNLMTAGSVSEISGYIAKKNIIRAVIPAHSEILYRSKRDKSRGRIYRSNKSQKATPTLSDIPCGEETDNPREFHNNSVIDHYAEHWRE